MSIETNILRFAKISLICVFVVVVAGSVVRITGSGMGCPDWPFCFGHLVPPTSEANLSFQPENNFSQGEMIIQNDTLWVANSDFKSNDNFQKKDWHKYPKHDYAVFNAKHTWIEYINRLATGVLGFPVLILTFFSCVFFIKKKGGITFLLSMLTLLGLGFEAWLGKLVVDGNLKENSITYHMLGTMIIIALLIAIIVRHTHRSKAPSFSIGYKLINVLMLLMSIAQVILGTQVREEIDVIAKNTENRALWIEQLSTAFEFHRTFALAIIAVAIIIFIINQKQKSPSKAVHFLFLILTLELLGGLALSYFEMPKLMQPFHLLLAIILFSISFFITLNLGKKKLSDTSAIQT